MIISKKISSSIAETLSANNIISEQEIPIYSYCLDYIIELFFLFIFAVLYGVFSHKLPETLIFLAVFTPLRSFWRRISCIHSKTVCHTFTYHLCICALFRCNILRTYMAMDCCLCNITVCNSCFIPCRHQKQTYDS